MVEEPELKSSSARRPRIRSECSDINFPLLLFSPRKDSFDEKVLRLMNRKDSLLSCDNEMSKMDVENDPNKEEKEIELMLYGNCTKRFL